MIIANNSAPKDILQKTLRELHKGSKDSRHPFRSFSLATFDTDAQMPNNRTVILRQVTNDWRLHIFTDNRSRKVEELSGQNKAALLFWHPYHKLQLRCHCSVNTHQNNDVAEQYWKQVRGPAQKAYTSLLAPGKPIDAPEEAYQWPEEHTMDHFCVLECIATHLQFLQMDGREHRRITFTRETPQDSWQGQWIVP